MKWVNQALDSVYKQTPRPEHVITSGRQLQKARTALRTGVERLDRDQRKVVNQIRRERRNLFRAWELREQFRALYQRIDPGDARTT